MNTSKYLEIETEKEVKKYKQLFHKKNITQLEYDICFKRVFAKMVGINYESIYAQEV